MNRRAFLSRLARTTAGLAVLPSIELLKTIAPPRRYWPGADFTALSDIDGHEAYVREYTQRFLKHRPVAWCELTTHPDLHPIVDNAAAYYSDFSVPLPRA